MDEKIMAKLDAGRQYRNVLIRDLETRNADEGEMIVEGYATTFGQTYELWRMDGYIVTEQIAAGAFDEADMSDVIMQYDHVGRVFARKSNGTLELRTDDHGLHVRADLSGTEEGRRLFEEIKGGYTTKMSFGFTVTEDSRTITEDHETNITTVLRTITKIGKLYDVSAVSLPANDATEISARSFGEGVIAELAEELRGRARKRKIIEIETEAMKWI